jgi:3-phenylpropionate/cinnamic acid dioxygenase small subunit
MSAAMIPSDADLIVRVRIQAFTADYVHALDADRLEEWPSFFTEDATYRVTTRENFERGLPLSVMSCSGRGMMADRISALRTANVYEPHVYCHVPGALRLTNSGSSAEIEAECTFLVVRTMVDGTMSLFAAGRSFDRFVDTPDGLRFSRRLIVLDSRQIDTLLVIPL